MLRLTEAEYDELRGTPLDPDPLAVCEDTYGTPWRHGFEAGRDLGRSEVLPRLRVIALAAFTGLLLGIIIAVSAAGALR